MVDKLSDTVETKRKELKDRIARDAENYTGNKNKQYNTEDINADLTEMVGRMGFAVKVRIRMHTNHGTCKQD